MAQNPLPTILQQHADCQWQRFSRACETASVQVARSDDLDRAFALSDFIAEAAIADPEQMRLLLQQGELSQSERSGNYQPALQQRLATCSDEPQLQRELRRFRREKMLVIAWRDLLGLATIEEGLAHISALADVLIMQALGWLYQRQCQEQGTPCDPAGEAQPMLVLGMGKLGGGELNFSSDIDLIFVFPEKGETQGGRRSIDNQPFFTRLGQRLISALNQTTADGFVYRVDMRLRPFGDSGPLVLSFAAAEEYYQHSGREWERYAMVKARLLGPRGKHHQAFEALLRPFVFRRYIDFGAIQSLREMKSMINSEVRRRNLTGNIKLGLGGIREIEFIVQVFQLIRGGREPRLQSKGLLATLEQVQALGLLTPEEARGLRDAYLFLRRTEHVLQEIGDKQTQLLPNSELDQCRLYHAMGFDGWSEFLQQLEQHMQNVRHQFNLVIGEEESEQAEESRTWEEIWLGTGDEQEILSQLQSLGCDPATTGPLWQRIQQFRQDSERRSMGARGRETLNRLMPQLLSILVGLPQADQVLARLTEVLRQVLTRTAYLELLNENNGALRQLVKLCAASPWIAEQLSRYPILLDELIDPAVLYHPPALEDYEDELHQYLLRIPEDDLEQQMEALRQFKQSHQLRIAASDISGALPLMKVSDHLTALAEALVTQVVHLAWQQISARFGTPAGLAPDSMGFAVIGYGKMGGLELGYGSDLDMVFLSDAPAGHTNGDRQIDNQQFYLKLAQRILHLFSTRTVSGVLYEVDMRLRPSGASGLLVVGIDGFERYQQQEAWTWEHQALVRSRLAFGDDAIAEKFHALRRQILASPREQELARQVVEMRRKMADNLDKSSSEAFDLKQGRGGIVDIEFLAQYLVLANAADTPALAVWSDNVRIFETLEQHGVISPQARAALTDAYIAYRNASHRKALQAEANLVPRQQFSDQAEQVSQIWNRYLSDYTSTAEEQD